MNLDLSALRTLVAAVELGGFGMAARQLHRTPGAVSLQLKALEERLGQELFVRKGKQQRLTASGEILLGYARRILQLNDEALLALKGADASGEVRFGMIQDLADDWLPQTLARFARTCPAVRIEVRVDRSSELQRALVAGELDLAAVFAAPDADDPAQLARLAVHWWGHPELALSSSEPLPLLLLESPCTFREAAIRALEKAGRTWRTVLSSGSVSAVWAAAEAGLGVTVRTAIHVPQSLQTLNTSHGLPSLGSVGLFLRMGVGKGRPEVQNLASFLRETVDQKMHRE
jgi:DNA-binding transcriptional LysR family regulator